MIRRNAFTLTELCVVILILGGMWVLLFPMCSYGNERKGRIIKCLSNMKTQGVALMMYVQDYDEHLPVNPTVWMDLSQRYVKNWDAYHCPSLSAEEYGYAFDVRMAGKSPEVLTNPDQTLLLTESTNRAKNACSFGESTSARHYGSGNIVFADGHAKRMYYKKNQEVFLKL